MLAALEAPVDDAADELDVPLATALPLDVVGSVAILMVVFLLMGTPVPALAAAAAVIELLFLAAAMAEEMVLLREVRIELKEAGTTMGAMPMAPVVLAVMLLGMLVVVVVVADADEEVAPPVRANSPE